MLRSTLLALMATALLAGCASTPRLRYDQDPGFDLAEADTFSFVEPLGTDRNGYHSLLSQRLMEATRRELSAKGYRYVEADPDLLVNFGARLDERVRTRTDPPAFGYYGYRAGLYGGWIGYRTRVDHYQEGTLSIDVVDPETDRLVWEGVAIGRVSDATLDDVGVQTDEAVTDVLRAFPERERDDGADRGRGAGD